MNQQQIKLLFLFSFIGIICTYLFFLGTFKTINLITDQYLFLLALLPIWIIGFNLKSKLKGYQIIDFHQKGNLTFKTTILIFLAFQVIDYIYEEGFIGMISQWFIYWSMGYVVFELLRVVNYYKNIKLQKALV